MTDVLTDLARCPLFASLERAEMEGLARSARGMSFAAGELIFREGQPCEGFFVVAEGSVRIYKLSPDGRERTLHIVRPPQAFAEAALFTPGGYPAFAAPLTDARLILVPREPFVSMLRERPDSAVRVFESLAQWVHRLLDELENESFLNARAKLATYLLRELKRQADGQVPGRIRLAHPKKDIASQLGMAPETFSRIQADLETRGLIQVAGRQIGVLDLDALQGIILGEE